MTQAFTSQPLQVKLLDPRFGDSWPLPASASQCSRGRRKSACSRRWL
jgi:dUTP pyrophosphatase